MILRREASISMSELFPLMAYPVFLAELEVNKKKHAGNVLKGLFNRNVNL